ncbi:MAG TPA: glycosyltransferase family 4 protein [Hanamia sp.]|nr:glycosyltransferase family 4 protein [Hanamia sp.]
MKVLFCTNAFEKVSNGPAKFAHLLLNEGGKADLEIRILTEETTFAVPFVYKLELNIAKPFRLLGQFVRMWRYHRTAMKIRRDFHFDFLVYNNAIIGLFSFLLFKRTVGMINDYTNASNSIVSVFKRKAKFNKRVIFYYVEYLTCHFSKCIIVNSEFLKKKLQCHYHCRASLFKVLHKGIENRLVKFDRKEVLLRKKPGSVLFVKTDFVLGGLFTLVDALKNINRKVKLTIVGPSDEHHKMIKQSLEEANVPFELFGYLQPDEVYNKMQEAEIFCVPSKKEAFGVANLEAMAMGCKIVSTNIGGIPEAVGDNGFVRLVTPDDPVALRIALSEAMGISMEKYLDDITNHLARFSSAKIILNFKKHLQKCF